MRRIPAVYLRLLLVRGSLFFASFSILAVSLQQLAATPTQQRPTNQSSTTSPKAPTQTTLEKVQPTTNESQKPVTKPQEKPQAHTLANDAKAEPSTEPQSTSAPGSGTSASISCINELCSSSSADLSISPQQPVRPCSGCMALVKPNVAVQPGDSVCPTTSCLDN